MSAKLSQRSRTTAIVLGCVAALLAVAIVVLLSVFLPRRARQGAENRTNATRRRSLRLKDVPGGSAVLGPWDALQKPYTPTCTPPALTYPAKTQIYATWYGVQTSGVVTIDMWKQNAADVLQYLNTSTIAWSGILIHIEPPASQTDSKPPNAYVYVDEIANFIAQIPITLRVGLQATVEQDSVWDLPFGQSKYARAAQFNNKFGYWADAKAANNSACTVATQDTDCGSSGYCDVNIAQGDTIPARCIPKSLYTQCCGDEPGSSCKDQKVLAPSTTYVPGPNNVFCSADIQGSEPGRLQGPNDCWCIEELTTTTGAIVRGCAPAWTPSSGSATSACQAQASSGTGGTGPVGIPPNWTHTHYIPYAGLTQCNAETPCPDASTTCWNGTCVPSAMATACGSDSCAMPDGTQFQQNNSVTGLWCNGDSTDASHTPMLTLDEMTSGYHGVDSAGNPKPWCYCLQYVETKDGAEKVTARFGAAADAPPADDCAVTSSFSTRGVSSVSKFHTFLGAGASASATDTNVINGGTCPTSSLPDAGNWQPTPAPGAALPASIPAPDKVTWYGGAGATGPASAVSADGSPYMVATDTTNAPNGTCPPKPVNDEPFTGCPNNMYHLGWYTALLNAILRERGSNQRISMMNWDAEGNGPTGVRCSIFQFLYAIRQFGVAEDVLPSVWDPTQCKMVPSKWLLFQNGSAGLTVDTAMSPSSTDPCNDWFDVGINLNPSWAAMPVNVLTTFGDMVQFVPAPEYYWFGGEDMGGVANGGRLSPKPGLDVAQSGLLKFLADAGYIGCPQSAVKMGYDANCGCRQTVYDTYARIDDGGVELLDLMQPLYNAYLNAGTAPTFSIEHVGNGESGVNFGLCINSRNFDSRLADSTDPTRANFSTVGCADADKCAPRCGVANFFGNWTEACFQQFLYSFANMNYDKIKDASGIARLMVYDLGFVPASWFDAAYAKTRNGFQPSIVPTGGNDPDPTNLTVAEYNAKIAGSGIEYNEVCPTNTDTLVLYNCPASPPLPDGSKAFWQHAPPGQPGNPTSGKLACYDCTDSCAFQANGAGIPTLTTYADPNGCKTSAATNKACSGLPPTPPPTPTPNPSTPTLSNFSNIATTLGAAPFTLTPPQSNSTGAFTYAIADSSVATVDASSGKVTVLAVGASTIVATQAAAGKFTSGSISATLTVSSSTSNVPTLSGFPDLSTTVGAAPFNLQSPTSDSQGAFSFAIDDATVATLTTNAQNGAILVTPLAVGTAKITATQAAAGAYSSASISATLTVSAPAPTITNFPNLSITLNTGTSSFTLAPKSTSPAAFTFASSDPSVAAVDSSTGVVSVYTAGTTTLTATQAASGPFGPGSASATLIVSSPSPSPSPPSPSPKPPKSHARPLTREPWFIATIVAAAALLVLVICIAVICSKRT